MKKYILMVCALLSAQLSVEAAEQFVKFSSPAQNALKLTGSNDTIRYSRNDWAGVKLAVGNLRKDLRAVTGSDKAPIIVATVGKSELAKRYAKQCKQLKGKWEKYLIFTDKGQLVILGSDKRGTIYGIYELSRQIGVSPWYWMADAPIAHHDQLYITPGTYTDGEPKVKYRGIFINDEWPSFGGWCTNKFGGINSKAYRHIFELLLRLKANYFWPAMWGTNFNEDDPESPRLADEMGIVMGTSHHEPMMRSHREYLKRKNEVGPWNYATNPERIEKFFLEGMKRNSKYDNLVTIGMRGDGDTAMGNGDDAENIKTLGKVVAAQRRIIEQAYGRPANTVPQLWAIFTEVQRYYDAGFTVPDDVTLLFCDNNWGYIRRKGTAEERKRKGGLGLYYHIDMNGGPWNDRWVNTTTIPKLREQLHEAYASGIDRIWIINVGDLKPKEVPIDFIMNYAWNPDAIQPGDEQPWLERFSSSIFGEENAKEIADMIAKYSKYNLMRKPEVQVPGIFNEHEMLVTSQRWNALAQRAENLRGKLPKKMLDAYYQLVYYPVVASANVAEIYNHATMGDSLGIEAMMQKDRELSGYYNNVMAGGKWKGMMSDNHIGYTHWAIPEKNVNPMTLGYKVEHPLNATTSATEIDIPSYQYARITEGKDAKWIFLPDLGRGKGCMGSSNVMAASHIDGKGAALEYDFDLKEDNDQLAIALGILPTQDVYPARGLRIGVQIDDQPMQIVDARQGFHDEFQEYTAKNLAVSKKLKPLPKEPHLALNGWWNGKKQLRRTEVFDNQRWLAATSTRALKAGKHTVRIVMIDPEIVLEQVVVNPDNSKYSYLGASL